MNARMKQLIEDAVKLLDEAIDEIESEDLGKDANYRRLSSVIDVLEDMAE